MRLTASSRLVFGALRSGSFGNTCVQVPVINYDGNVTVGNARARASSPITNTSALCMPIDLGDLSGRLHYGASSCTTNNERSATITTSSLKMEKVTRARFSGALDKGLPLSQRWRPTKTARYS